MDSDSLLCGVALATTKALSLSLDFRVAQTIACPLVDSCTYLENYSRT